jgi:NAD+ kinase
MRGCLVVRHAGGESLAFNDAVVARVPGEGMVEATMSVSGRRYGRYRCDALILGTPMGSTAYSYAAGGPVVSPGAQGILVTPSAPLSGISHSLLLGPNEPLRLELTAGRPAFELDGVLTGRLESGEVLEVEWRPDAGRLVRLAGSRAADRSRVKLSLLDLPLLPQELQELVPESLRRRFDDGARDPS